VLIAVAFEKAPFHSVHSLANIIKVSPVAVWRHFHSAGYVVLNLGIVPHTPSLAQKVNQVKSTTELKKTILPGIHRDWHYTLTGDESWCSMAVSNDHIWLPEEAMTSTRLRKMVSIPK
jgi:hypothetical protein